MLDWIENSLVRELRKDSRRKAGELSLILKFPQNTVKAMLSHLDKLVLKKITILIDFSKLGFNIHVFFVVNTPHFRLLRSFLLSHQNVNTAFKSSEGSVLAECYFKDLTQLYSFKEKLFTLGVTSAKIFHLVEECSKEAFLPGLEKSI